MTRLLSLLALLCGLASPGLAEGVPPEVAAALRQIGPAIDPPATARLYAPLQPREPFAGVAVTRDQRYGEDARHRLDVFAPSARGPARPVLVFVHGGAYVAGDKQLPGSPFYANIGAWAVGQGMVGVNLTYRLAPAHPWPAAQQDIGAALRWVAAHIVEYGGDPTRIFLAGHSAGAAHVATYAAHPELQRAGQPELRALVLISGRYDLELGEVERTTEAYYGTDRAGYAARSAMAGMLAARLPVFLAWAELDPPMFLAQAGHLAAALCGAGRCPQRMPLPQHSHMSEVYAIGTADTSLTQPLLAFLRRH
jgi:triacylglycerol lipase